MGNKYKETDLAIEFEKTLVGRKLGPNGQFQSMPKEVLDKKIQIVNRFREVNAIGRKKRALLQSGAVCA